jgi:hypothetical protein
MEKHFAVIKEGIVENTIVCEAREIAENVTGRMCIEYDIVLSGETPNAPHIGLGYNAETGEFEQPLVPEVPEIDLSAI